MHWQRTCALNPGQEQIDKEKLYFIINPNVPRPPADRGGGQQQPQHLILAEMSTVNVTLGNTRVLNAVTAITKNIYSNPAGPLPLLRSHSAGDLEIKTLRNPVM